MGRNKIRAAAFNLGTQPFPCRILGGNSVVTPVRDAAHMKPQPDRTGLLILRLWIEGNARDGFRARITQTLDSGGMERAVAMASTPEGVRTVVQNWVDAFINSN